MISDQMRQKVIDRLTNIPLQDDTVDEVKPNFTSTGGIIMRLRQLLKQFGDAMKAKDLATQRRIASELVCDTLLLALLLGPRALMQQLVTHMLAYDKRLVSPSLHDVLLGEVLATVHEFIQGADDFALRSEMSLLNGPARYIERQARKLRNSVSI